MNNLPKIRPLKWGLYGESLKKRWPDVFIDYNTNSISYGLTAIQPYPGDCGALLITRANYTTKKNLKVLCEIASACGFNKIFATVVGSYVEEALAAFKANRFKRVYSGYSNRKDDKHTKDYVLVKYIRNCEWKGYGWDRG